MTLPLVLSNLLQRWQERRVRRRDQKTGIVVNVPLALDEFRKRQALDQVQRDLRERRGRW